MFFNDVPEFRDLRGIDINRGEGTLKCFFKKKNSAVTRRIVFKMCRNILLFYCYTALLHLIWNRETV